LAQHHQTELHRMRTRSATRRPARAGELTAGMAHEVRNGLGTILGYARLIERGASPEEIEEAARQIREECETLETVVAVMEFVKRETLIPAPSTRAHAHGWWRARPGTSGAEVELSAGDWGPVTGDEDCWMAENPGNAREAAGPEAKVSARGGGRLRFGSRTTAGALSSRKARPHHPGRGPAWPSARPQDRQALQPEPRMAREPQPGGSGAHSRRTGALRSVTDGRSRRLAVRVTT
jgi:hypothetical protein